ncbi:MAG: purple acid phosphatase [Deltaproteobacteria bacterium]|nr:purple acid phosphatase [Deltaproteobacteria bacterium]
MKKYNKKSYLGLIICLGILIFALAGCSSDSDDFVPWYAATGEEIGPLEDPPIHVHLTWEDDPLTSITIAWQTSHDTPTSTVEYSPSGSIEKLYAIGSAHTYDGASGVIHEVTIRGLEPSTRYYYRCGDQEGGWSGVDVFDTGVYPDQDFSFVVLGDSRSHDKEKRQVVEAIMAEDPLYLTPLFLLHSGDLINDGDHQEQWDQWFDTMDDLIRHSPLMPCLGNHEVILAGQLGLGLAPYYYEQFALPGIERWYSFDYGCVHFTILNSEERLFNLLPGTPQLNWLIEDLEKADGDPDILWKIVMFHRPPYSTGPHGDDTIIQRHWCPIFDEYHVDVAFNGHDHLYQRTYPIYDGKVTDTSESSYDNPTGTVYIVSAGAGAPLYQPDPNNFEKSKHLLANYEVDYHFCKVEVLPEEKTLHMEAKDRNGNPFDELWIYKDM